MLQNPFKGFKSMFNEEETKVGEDEAKMEDASSWKESTRRRRRMAVLMCRGASPGATPFPRRRKQTRWFPIFPPRVSSSSPHPRVHLLSRMKCRNRSEILDLSYFRIEIHFYQL